MKQIQSVSELKTKCGKQYGISYDPFDEKKKCPSCGRQLYADDDRIHDGYCGSAHAHNGNGSLGESSHHYYLICPICSNCECTICTTGLSKNELKEFKTDFPTIDINSYDIIEELYEWVHMGGFLSRGENFDNETVYSVDDFPIYDTILLPVKEKWSFVTIDGLIDMDEDDFDKTICKICGVLSVDEINYGLPLPKKQQDIKEI